MRLLSCKRHCPICFCKSPVPIFSPCPLKLDDAQNVPSSVSSIPDVVEQLVDEKVEVENIREDGEVSNLPKSNLRKPSVSNGKEVGVKGRVQWMDLLGKDLVEIREFEPSESEHSQDESDGNQSCVCVIL